MSAKFLHAFVDENPELHRQIGCMSGIFQMFDRHHLLTGKHKRISSGASVGATLLNSSNLGAEHSSYPPHILLERNPSKSLNENQISMESSGTSFSSSSCSSFSSLDGNKSTKQEPPSLDRSFYAERSIANPQKQNYEFDAKPATFEPRIGPANYAKLQSGQQSLDFREVVKDSIYKDNHPLQVKTSAKQERKSHTVKHRDSPRPMQLPKSIDGSYLTSVEGKARMPVDFDESLRVLVKLKEARCHLPESNEPRRKSCEGKDVSFSLVSKEAPRFSYDGSLDSRDGRKPCSKLRELPRLSLDSREGSLQKSSNFDSRPHSDFKDLDRSSRNQRAPMASSDHLQELASHKRRPSVVAKLMGLEAMPNLSQEKVLLAENHASGNFGTFSEQKNSSFIYTTSTITQDSKEDRLSRSPKSSIKDPVTPRLKNPDSFMKPISNLRISVEPTPWRQHEKIHIRPKMMFKCREANMKQQPESVYSEIEKRLKELEFQQSNKDLRALKQILDAMHEKGLLETKKGEEQLSETSANVNSSVNVHNLRPIDTQNKLGSHTVPTTSVKGSSSPRAFDSPIVIMKPATSIDRSRTSPSNFIPIEALTVLRRIQTSTSSNGKRKTSSNIKMSKDQAPNASSRELSRRPPLSTDKKYRKEENGLQKARLRVSDGSSRPLELPRDNDGSSIKTSNSLSPRLYQRKLEIEKKSRPPLPSSESNKPQRQSANRHSSESLSPGGRHRRKQGQAQQNDDQLSDVSSGTRSLSHLGDGMSLRSESNVILSSEVGAEVTVANKSAEMNLPYIQQGFRSPSGRVANSASSAIKQKAIKLKDNSSLINEEVSAAEQAIVSQEQPSPISVLDSSFYQDDSPSSPVKKSQNALKDDDDDERRTPLNCCTPANVLSPRLSSGINQKKLENIENLVQKLRQLSSSGDEAPASDHIALLCDTQSPDHRYVSEILLASGILMRDLTCGAQSVMPLHLQASGHPINPDLFLVLEQTKSGSLTKPRAVNGSAQRLKSDPEKLHRKLVFDVVNELLKMKLELSSSPDPYPELLLRARNARLPNGQRLLRELCTDIEQFKAESSNSGSSDDGNNLASGEEMLRQSQGQGWSDFGKETSAMVLEIERSIFKDLIDEVVDSEAASSCPHAKASRRRRELFVK